MARLLKILMWICGTILVLNLALSIIYQRQIKKAIVNEINKTINVPVNIRDLSLSPLRSFPNISLKIKYPRISESNNVYDQYLLEAQSVFISVKIIPLLKNKVEINSIRIENATLRLGELKNGITNYNIFKKQNNSSSEKSFFQIQWKDFSLKNINLEWFSEEAQTNLKLKLTTANIIGSLNNEELNIDLACEGIFNQCLVNKNLLLKNKDLSLKGKLNYNSKINNFSSDGIKFSLGEMNFDLFGNYMLAENIPFVNLNLKGKSLELDQLLPFALPYLPQHLSELKAKGKFDVNSSIKGSIANNKGPKVILKLALANGSLSLKGQNISNINTQISLNFNDNKTWNLDVANLDLTTKNGFLNGHLSLNSANRFKGKAKGAFDLNEIEVYLGKELSISGSTNFSSQWDFEMNSENKIEKDAQIVMLADVKNLYFKNSDLDLTNASANISLYDSLIIDNLSAQINGTSIHGKLLVNHALKTFIGDESLIVRGEITADKFNLNQWIDKYQNKTETEESDSLKINASIKLHLAQFEWNKLKANNIFGYLNYSENSLQWKNLSLNAFDGTLLSNGLFAFEKDPKLSLDLVSNNIELSKLFASFDDFGQENIKSHQISGNTKIHALFNAPFNQDYVLQTNLIESQAYIKMNNGKLKGVEALKQLSKFIDLKDLEMVEFSELENVIKIKNGSVEIPKMEIKSNAANLEFAGTHSFINKIDYKIKVNISDILLKKTKLYQKDRAVLKDEEGKLFAYIHMTGNATNPVIKYDKQSSKEALKTTIQKEKEMLKNEFKKGLFNSPSFQKPELAKDIWDE